MHTQTGRPSWRLKDFFAPIRHLRRPFWQEIALALLLKLALLIGIKWMFFSHPVSKPEAAARLGRMIAGDAPVAKLPASPAAPTHPESK